jgi:hypothetical protein
MAPVFFGSQIPVITFTKVRNDWIERHDLTPTEKLVGMYLHGRMRRHGKPWLVDNDQIASALGITPYAAKKAVATLRRLGHTSDNRKPVRDASGQIRRARAIVNRGRRGEVIAPDLSDSLSLSHVSPGRTESRKTDVGETTSYELLKDERLYVDPWSVDVPAEPELVAQSPADTGVSSDALTPSESSQAALDVVSPLDELHSPLDLDSQAGDLDVPEFDVDEFKRESRERLRHRTATYAPTSRRFRDIA